jgi:hypothetical protein
LHPPKMPKVLSYTPPWLSRPSPGFDVFAPRSSSKATNGHKVAQEYSGPTKTIATRGTEVFVAVGNEIRWSNLVELQERNESPTYRQGHSQSRQSRSSLQDNAALHRVSKAAPNRVSLTDRTILGSPSRSPWSNQAAHCFTTRRIYGHSYITYDPHCSSSELVASLHRRQ